MADLALARKVLETEAAAILALVPRLDERFECAVQLLHTCRGRAILTGMGKSGIICRKIAATLSSTGTPAFFLHPAEAIHGDLGVLQKDDVVVAVSQSGETGEILRLLETIRRIGARLIAVTGVPQSTLARGEVQLFTIPWPEFPVSETPQTPEEVCDLVVAKEPELIRWGHLAVVRRDDAVVAVGDASGTPAADTALLEDVVRDLQRR